MNGGFKRKTGAGWTFEEGNAYKFVLQKIITRMSFEFAGSFLNKLDMLFGKFRDRDDVFLEERICHKSPL